ncbi:hypothetical protein [Nocardioides convexus]|uniref:hypothetical protein n=1 Tax=Nocardioides convexus TaxID=2712224 RepID=UPI0024184470|nr:hypothetical protein [Nocardioides convexus]
MIRRAQQSGQDPQEFVNHMFEHNHVPEPGPGDPPRQGAADPGRGCRGQGRLRQRPGA